jgi:FkbM family methyltransferase
MKNWARSGIRALIRLVPRMPYPVVHGPLRGARFVLGTLAGEGGGASVYLNMIEPEQTSALLRTLKNGDVFFDIGANVGYYTILGARLVGAEGRVFAFEPVVRNIVHLYHHVSLNRASNVTIVPAACSDTLSLETFSAGRNFATGHLGGDSDAQSRYPVLTVPLDELTQRVGVHPNVVKIDVEGAELSVLKGAQVTLQKARPKVLLSTHSDLLREACLEYLKQFGFVHEVLSEDKSNPSEFLAMYAGRSGT